MRLPLAAICVAALWSASVLPIAVPAAAQSAHGEVGRGRLSAELGASSGTLVAFAGDVTFEGSGDQFRLDVTSLSVTSGKAKTVQLTPAGGLTLVIDRKTQRYVVWSAAKREFFWGDLPKPPSPFGNAATPRPAPTTTPSPAPNATTRPEHSAFSGLKDIKVFSAGIDMSGHGTTDGHPSTGFAYHLHSESNAGKIEDVHGVIQTADDLDGLPILLTAEVSLSRGTVAKLHAELTSFEKRDPSKFDFLVPRGYTAAANPLEIIMPNFSGMKP